MPRFVNNWTQPLVSRKLKIHLVRFGYGHHQSDTNPAFLKRLPVTGHFHLAPEAAIFRDTSLPGNL
jgi:hypothetical protein